LWIVGEDKRSLSAFHAANIAAGLAARRLRVRVFELSGLLPNVAFYFCLSPGIYLDQRTTRVKEFCPGLNGVSVVFDSVAPRQASVDDSVTINLVHMPPPGERLAALADELTRPNPPAARGIFLSHGAPGRGSKALESWLGADAVFELTLGNESPPGYCQNHLGAIANWQGAVVDRIPSVVRNPNSTLARNYLGVVDSLLARVQAVRQRGTQGEGHRFATIQTSR
jgi:hypothetical protein